ncbi:MAG: ABC transporter substrate-binding protein [Actinomycetota bacterium]
MRRSKMLAGLAIMIVIAAACSSNNGGGGSSASASASTGGEPVTITIWHNYGTEQNATALQNLVDAFQTANPNITVDVVSQPGDNYFALLKAAAISKTGPDLAVQWTGLFTLQDKSYLQNLKGLIPDADLARIDPDALKWTSDNFDATNGPYVIPLENQFYIGFYNKQAFSKAGVSTFPSTWSELFAACTKLNAAGYTPLVYGNGGQPLGAEFYPWYDMSYLMIGAHPLPDWKSLYDGQIPWTSSENAAQLTNWAKLQSSGCTNQDVLTKTNNLGDFEKGRAAMIIDGTWDTQKFTDVMGDNVAAFVPPFSDSPMQGVVQFAGDGLSMMSYSQHKTEAAAFLDFMTTDQAAQLIDQAGLIPAIVGSSTSNPVNQQMLNFALTGGLTPYPMLDNVVQSAVVDVGNKLLPSMLAGQTSPSDALSQLEAALNALPADQRGTTYTG